ncbi:MAG: hypothetical protein GXY03_03470 [Solirubrobacterales bacterium]|nr:hypothetical protein [Solirubrobacterales bacterium]
MRRFRTGWDLTKKSWRLLRSQPGLTAYPIAAAVSSVLAFVVFAGPGFLLVDTESSAAGYALIAVGAYLSAFSATFFGVALAAAADRAFRGERVTLGTGVAVASGHLGAIAGWALVAAIVTSLLTFLQSQRGLAGPIIAMLGGAAWGLITFLAIPVIAIEGTGPFATIRRSAGLFKERWRGQITGNVAIGGAVVLFGVLPAIGLITLGVVLWIDDGAGASIAFGGALVFFGALLLVVSLVLAQAMRQVFGVALYRWTADGDAVGGFTPAELDSAVRMHSRSDAATA